MFISPHTGYPLQPDPRYPVRLSPTMDGYVPDLSLLTFYIATLRSRCSHMVYRAIYALSFSYSQTPPGDIIP